MQRRVWVLAALVLAAPLAGCVDRSNVVQEPAGNETGSSDPGRNRIDRTLADWRETSRDRRPAGVQASFRVEGTPLRIFGDLRGVAAEAPVDLVPGELFPSDRRFLFFANATVDGMGPGVLVLEGDRISASSGRLADVHVDELTVNGTVNLTVDPIPEDHPDEPDLTFPSSWEDANRSFFFGTWMSAQVHQLTVSGHDRALLLVDDQAHELGDRVTVTARGLWWDDQDSRIEAETATARTGDFAVGGNGTAGTVEGEDLEVAAPAGVFGYDGTLVADGGSVASKGMVQVTQVLTAEGPQIPAQVEVITDTKDLEMTQGETAWVRVGYREATSRGDAILDNVTVKGSGAEMITVPLERPPLLVQELWEFVLDTGPVAPFAILPVAVASPFLILLEVLACIVDTCPGQNPYPSWMDTGAVDDFYFKVEATNPPGSYPATIQILGENHDTVEIPITVEVTRGRT